MMLMTPSPTLFLAKRGALSMSTKSAPYYEEKVLPAKSGMVFLICITIGFIASIAVFCLSVAGLEAIRPLSIVGIVLSTILFIALCCMCPGFHVIKPNEAMVALLFGKYIGSLKEEGFYWANPFAAAFNPTKKPPAPSVTTKEEVTDITIYSNSSKISLKSLTLNNEKQKVNDKLGNPIIIGIVVIWRVVNTAKAAFNVDNYKEYLSIQCDSALRNIVRLYPYDCSNEDENEKSLRSSGQEISEKLKEEIQSKVNVAGLEIQEARITHLSYAPEIASVMLQRQQASAIIDARQMIVDGAVGMVEMALDKLNANDIVHLDEERKAAMVSNLLVVLCSGKEPLPVVNSGTLY
jgi:regulator of protease activity HflC (stomatin/prohibitin superfamily)